MKKTLFFVISGCLMVLANGSYCQSEKAIVKIGKQSFTVRDFEQDLDSMRLRTQNLNTDMKRRILDQFVREKLFVAAAIDAAVKITDEQKKNIEKLEKMYLIRNYIDQILKEDPVTETEVKQTYNKDPQQYKTMERRKLRHIIVKDEEKAKEILTKLKKGASFEELASQNNIDATKQRGGDLGWANKGIFVKEFEDVAFSLKKGETSGIVKTRFGYHIIRVDAIEEPKQRSFSDVEQEIRRKLETQKILELEEKLKKRYNVQVDYSLLESVKIGK